MKKLPLWSKVALACLGGLLVFAFMFEILLKNHNKIGFLNDYVQSRVESQESRVEEIEQLQAQNDILEQELDRLQDVLSKLKSENREIEIRYEKIIERINDSDIDELDRFFDDLGL